ncbi:molybdopterin-binding protein [Jannaschia sp. EhC01]|nr:molybdopterin-binding protein [Jannaschia sp. EhC01]
MPKHDVAVIVLAAGLSRRMGARNKLLLPVGGVPMIRHMVGVYAQITARPVVVVTGHEAPEIEAALAGSGADTVFNREHAQGQPTSVACGLRAAPADLPVLIGLGDQPLLSADDLRALIAAHLAGDRDRISIPLHNDRRGNPIVIPAALRARLLEDPASPGCKKFTRAHPEHVHFHPLSAPGFYADIDTPEAFDALNEGASP